MKKHVQLTQLLEAAGFPFSLHCIPSGSNDELVFITSVERDSRNCIEGSMYCAFHGLHVDGNDFMEDAVGRGASAILCDQLPQQLIRGTTYILTPHPRRAYALCCAAFFGNPEKKLRIIGVTGTDGKSTTSEYLWSLLNSTGCTSALLGTVSRTTGGQLEPSPYRQSTPEAWELYSFFSECVQKGTETVVLETTSHALSPEYDRLAGITFSGAIFTTLTHEHMEFHKTKEAYVEAKLMLARRLKPGAPLIVPYDNPYYRQILEAAPQACSLTTEVLEADQAFSSADIHAVITARHPRSMEFTLTADAPLQERDHSKASVSGRFSTPFPFMLSNAVEALCMVHLLLGHPFGQLVPHMEKLTPARGRLQFVDNNLGATILIDFAHTADAFHHVMSALRAAAPHASMTVVFGAAGERDTSKRAPMGSQAAIWCERLIITDEDPRNEGFDAISRDILSGIPEALKLRRTILLIKDRSKAIKEAVDGLQAGDILLVLGKGHETSIEMENGRKIPWDEVHEVRTSLAAVEACKGSCSL